MNKLPETGVSETFRKTMTVAEQAFFTGISGNLGRSHVDRTYAQGLGLPDMAVFELAAATLFSTAFGRIAGPGYRLRGIEMNFIGSMVIGQSIAATATVTESTAEAIHFALRATADGTLMIEGTAQLVPIGSGHV